MKTTFMTLSLCGVLLAIPVWAAEINRDSTLDDTYPPQTIATPATDFARVIDGLPMMPGLRLVQDQDVLFAAPKSGSIAETNAEGEVDVDSVYNFYKRSLPQLGWKRVDMRTYDREHEHLTINAHADDKVTHVQFLLTPDK
jgi:hypothetical protein